MPKPKTRPADLPVPVRIVLEGAPRTKKNSSRIVRMGRRARLLPSAAFRAYQEACLWQLRDWSARPPIDGWVGCAAIFYRDRDVGDLNNYTAALADILEKAGVLVNDRLIRSWDGSRVDKDPARPRVEVLLTSFDG